MAVDEVVRRIVKFSAAGAVKFTVPVTVAVPLDENVAGLTATLDNNDGRIVNEHGTVRP